MTRDRTLSLASAEDGRPGLGGHHGRALGGAAAGLATGGRVPQAARRQTQVLVAGGLRQRCR